MRRGDGPRRSRSSSATRPTTAIVERCRAGLAGFKVPRRVIALDALPTTPARTASGAARRTAPPGRGAHEPPAESRIPVHRRRVPHRHSDRGSRPHMSSLAEPGWEAIARSPQFRELVASRRRFVAHRAPRSTPGTSSSFLALLGFAQDFMAKEVAGHLARAARRLQRRARSTVVMALGSTRGARERVGRAWRERRSSTEARPMSAARRQPATSTTLAVAIFAVVLAITLRASPAGRPSARTAPPSSTPPAAASAGRANGVATAGDYLSRLDVPGLRGPDVPVRLRRLDHRPRRLPVVPAGALPARRADAQRRQVHRRRRARLPPADAARARRDGDQHAADLRHLPRRPARRRGRA